MCIVVGRKNIYLYVNRVLFGNKYLGYIVQFFLGEKDYLLQAQMAIKRALGCSLAEIGAENA